METKQNLSEYDRKAIAVLRLIVEGQTSKLNDGEGHTYTSHVVRVDDDCNMTIVKKDDKVIARFVYDYESGEETEVGGEQ